MTRSLSGAPPKPLSNSPQGERAPHNRLKHSRKGLPPLGEGMGRGFKLQATLTELRFPSPGLRAKHATLGKHPH